MLKGIKLRLYPNRTQQAQLCQMFGNDRFVWNQMLAMMDERYQNNKALPFLSKFKLDYLLKPLKKEYPFLKKRRPHKSAHLGSGSSPGSPPLAYFAV